MIYIYDLLVNLSNEMYDFYDWEETDNLTHIRKIMLVKVFEKDYANIIFKRTRVSLEFLNMIKDKTHVYKKDGIDIINYSCVFTNGVNSFMACFDSKGYILKKSKFLVNEELEINELASKLKITHISYNIINSKFNYNKMLREEKEKIELIINELESIKDSKEKIDYLYYEWFNKSNCDNKYDELIKDIKLRFTNKHNDFLEVLNLLKV